MTDEKLDLDEDMILEYLDTAIRHWRALRDASSSSEEQEVKAVHYIDAYQSVRANIFGAILNEEHKLYSDQRPTRSNDE